MEAREGVRRYRGIAAAALAVLAIGWMTAPAEAKRILYVSGFEGDRIAAHEIAANGALSTLPGSPFSTPVDSPAPVTLTPDGGHLFVAGFDSGNVGAFAVGADGRLAGIPGSPFGAEDSPIGNAVSPDGRHLYVTNRNSSNVSAYSIGVGGTLAPLPGSPFAAGAGPHGIALTPNGSHAYVANRSDSSVSAYSVGADGALTQLPGSPFAAEEGANSPVLTPDGRFLYVANSSDDNLTGYRIEVDGTLSPLPGFPVPTGSSPQFTAISPDGRALFVANNSSENVSAYAIGADGALTPAAGSPFTAGEIPFSAVVSPDGRHLYVGNFDSEDVSAYAIGAGAVLTPITGSPFATAESPDNQSLAITPNQPPQARFVAGTAGLTVHFDARATTDPDGSPARFDWNFGDGSTLLDGGPTPTHTYAGSGRYDVSLTVTDNEGCSVTFVFTGQTASCNGGPAARASQPVEVAALPSCPSLKVSVSAFRRGASKAGTVPGLRVRLRSSQPAQQQVRASLVFRLDGKRRALKLGQRRLKNSGSRILRFSVPRSLRDDLVVGKKVRLSLAVASTPVAAAGCVNRSQLSLRARLAGLPGKRR